MSCADKCLMVDYDCYNNDFYRESIRRAAKAYVCCECGDPIAVGDSHQYVAGKSEGTFWDYRTCLVCEEIRGVFSCDAWMFSTLWDDIRDQIFPGWNEMTAIDCLARLSTDAAIAKMRAEYAEYTEDQA